MEELSSLQKEGLTLLCFCEQSVDGHWGIAWGLGGFPEGSDGKKNLPAEQETWVPLWVGKIPWRKEWLTTLGFLPENPRDRGAWRAAVYEVTQSRIRLK